MAAAAILDLSVNEKLVAEMTSMLNAILKEELHNATLCQIVYMV